MLGRGGRQGCSESDGSEEAWTLWKDSLDKEPEQQWKGPDCRQRALTHGCRETEEERDI